jgi:hypothetical protein
MKELFKAAKKSGSSVNALLNAKQPGNTKDDEEEQDERQLPASASPVVEREPATSSVQLPSNTAHSTVHTPSPPPPPPPPPSHIINNHLVDSVLDTDAPHPQEEQPSALSRSSSQDLTPTNDQPTQLQQPDANEAPESTPVAPSAQSAPLESAAPVSATPCHDCSEMSETIQYERESWRKHEGEVSKAVLSRHLRH